MVLKKKRQPKTNTGEPKSKPPDGMTAHERLYLERLQKSVTSPRLSPYLPRKGPDRPVAPTSWVKDPLFDSGPQTAQQVLKSESPPQTEHAVRGRTPVSLESADGHVRRGPDGVYELQLDLPSADVKHFEERARDRLPGEQETVSRGPRVEAQSAHPSSESQPSSVAVDTIESKDLFPQGTLVLWDENKLGIYKKHLDDKDYDLLYVVEPDGRLQPKGVCLFAYEPKRLGLLSEGLFHWMEQTMRWDRDALLCHFGNPQDAGAVAVLREEPRSGSHAADSPPEGEKFNGNTLVRGRTFTVNVGKHKWHGIFWGHDQLGTVVAHNTNRQWNLMHFDFHRFGSSVAFGDVLPDEQIQQIEAALNGKQE